MLKLTVHGKSGITQKGHSLRIDDDIEYRGHLPFPSACVGIYIKRGDSIIEDVASAACFKELR